MSTLIESIGAEAGEYLTVMNRNGAATITLHRPPRGRRYYAVDGRYLAPRDFGGAQQALAYALSGLTDDAADVGIDT